jgi:hypothetical protein
MTERRDPCRRRLTSRLAATTLLGVVLLTACAGPSPSVSPAGDASASQFGSEPASAPAATPTSLPTATPEPPLSLDLPETEDPRTIRLTVAPEVPADSGGRIVVTVTNLSDERVGELVLRWPTALTHSLFLAPFAPTRSRIANGGPPLTDVQDWTKWVVGPGERGEPAGTISLGWGPLDPGATLTIPILVTRRAAGPVAFDLQVLAGEAILLLESGEPAELRVSVP